MRQLKPLSGSVENDRVLTNHVTFANRSNPNLAPSFFFCFQNLSKCFGRSTRRIFFHLVMRFDNLSGEIIPELFSSFTCQPEENVDPDAEIRCKDDWHRLRGVF